ncbi:MAG: class I SAM-dependent methyltransferase [Thermoleophilaceae bacterium]|nr:class I SAM-dependent methyltransferase [Thermoleophilaceae bacterium]
MDFAEFKQRQSRTWGQGDYAVLSQLLAPAARELCDACAVSAGQEVLDVAAGDGNFALACAEEGASVVATDLAPGMVERGMARMRDEGVDVEWQVADAEALPFGDGRFECAGSVFGVMLAPRPEVAARELFRVVRPGNTVGLTAWTPDSFPAEMFRIGRRYSPPPPDVPESSEWGHEDLVRRRLDGLAGTLDIERSTVTWEAESPEALVALMERGSPPMAAARQALPAERMEDMLGELLELIRRLSGGDGPVAIEGEYLLIVARKRG